MFIFAGGPEVDTGVAVVNILVVLGEGFWFGLSLRDKIGG